MKSTEILGVTVDALSEAEALASIRQALDANRRLQVVTVNNEAIMLAQRDDRYRRVLNDADLRVADATGIIWAAHYLKQPKGGYGQAVTTLLQLLLSPSRVRTVIPETIPGSDLSVALAGLCEEFAYPLFLLGGAEGVAAKAGQKLTERFPRLQVAGAVAGDNLTESEQVETIRASKAAVLLVAYGQPKQDAWIARNLPKLPAPLVAVGVGGTFDYLTGEAPVDGGRPAKQPPGWIRRRGLEWLWRLITQPSRWRRIVTALPLFVRAVVRSHPGQKH